MFHLSLKTKHKAYTDTSPTSETYGSLTQSHANISNTQGLEFLPHDLHCLAV